jgi:predicted enzyme related to lactoylglutathione lyase
MMQSFLETRAKNNSSDNQTTSVRPSNMLGLRLAVYHVNDIDKAKLWYAKVLETKPNFDQPFYVGFSVGAFELGLVPEKGESSAKPAGVIAYWGVEDAKASYKRLIDMGAKPGDPVTDVGGGILAATVIDPFGNQFGIIQNPYFKQD